MLKDCRPEFFRISENLDGRDLKINTVAYLQIKFSAYMQIEKKHGPIPYVEKAYAKRRTHMRLKIAAY